ncbi:MAG: triose-phosphate isomerase [Anaerolineaceae bacterium]|jgi:triosephosphate isomerase
MKKRRPMVAGNWKMNKGLYETRELLRELLPTLEGETKVDIVVCPPFVGLGVAVRELDGSNVMLGAQNMHWEENGAYTGEIAPSMVKELCQYVILGHSERRAMFGETDESVNKKVHAALKVGLRPIVCVGETLDENQNGLTNTVVERQVSAGLANLNEEQAREVVVAYEPVWAIGTGLAATPEDANNVHKNVIRPLLRDLFGETVGDGIRILYGGSVNETNAKDLFDQSDIDGGLIGGASLKAASFSTIVKAAQ